MSTLTPFDVHLHPVLSRESAEKRVRLFKRRIEALGGIVNDHYILQSRSVIFRVHMSEEDAATVREWIMVRLVTKPSKSDTFDWHITS